MIKKLRKGTHPKGSYIDSDGVRRGWYVYQHVDNANNKVFYVGKGIGNRAWSDKRNRHWHEYVSNLTEGYTVEIVKDDLSDLESIALEQEIIEQHGGGQLRTGDLTNISPGENVGIRISVDMFAEDPEVQGLLKKYEALIEKAKESGDVEILRDLGVIEDEVSFITESRLLTEELVRSFDGKLNSIYHKIYKWIHKHDDSTHEELAEVSITFNGELYAIGDTCRDYLKRRISWGDFCEDVWMRIGEVTYAAENLKDAPPDFDIDYEPVIAVIKLVSDFSKKIVVED